MKILLADGDAAIAEELKAILQSHPDLHIIPMRPSMLLEDAVITHRPDAVIVLMARPRPDALDSFRRLARSEPTPVVVFLDQDDPPFMEEAISAGVFSYNVVGLPPSDMRPVLRAAIALFRRHHALQKQLREAAARLEERAVVDHAKAVLIRERRMSEPDAYHWLRRRAMGRGRRIAEIAREFLDQSK